MSSIVSGLVRGLSRALPAGSTTRRSMGHTVRIIMTDDLDDPGTSLYKDDVVNVRAGYARNYLVPQKKAVYATRQNFAKLGVQDPDQETTEERQSRLAAEAQAHDDQDLKAFNVLQHYLRNKTLKIWRNIDPSSSKIHPGMVDARAIRRKLSRQLRIDLEPEFEKVHVHPEPVFADELSGDEIQSILEGLGDSETPCTVELRELGSYLARVSLRGGYSVPLKLDVVKR